MWSQSWASGGRRLVIFFGLVLSLKLQIELSGIHRSRKVYSAEPQGVRKLDFYSESLSVECLCCYICNATGRGFQKKPRICFILIKRYKIATLLDTLTSLHNLNSTELSIIFVYFGLVRISPYTN